MNIYQVTLEKERDCHKCGKKIKPGETAVKSTARVSSCSATEMYHVYYHLACWRPKK